MKQNFKRPSFFIADILESDDKKSSMWSQTSTDFISLHDGRTELPSSDRNLINICPDPFAFIKHSFNKTLMTSQPPSMDYKVGTVASGQEGRPSALNALIQMTTSSMTKLNHDLRTNATASCHIHPKLLHMYSKGEPTFKKRRKSRTAFTNQQIVELERRFSQQKYLAQGDRDQIAQLLNLTNSQVITWFQNRRAKLKRELEERKNDLLANERISKLSDMSHHSNSHVLFLNPSAQNQMRVVAAERKNSISLNISTAGYSTIEQLESNQCSSGQSTDTSLHRFFYRSTDSPALSSSSSSNETTPEKNKVSHVGM